METRFRWISHLLRGFVLGVTPRLNLLHVVCAIRDCMDANSTDIRVRSAKHEKVLREEWDEAQKMGVDFSSVHFDKLLKM